MFPCEKSQLTAEFVYGKLLIHRVHKEIKMNILVLGGTRFMGKHLVSALLRKGHKITIATRGMAENVCEKTGKALLLSKSGEPAPYNGEAPYTINTELANSIGFSFTPLHQWIWTLIDHYLKELNV